MPGHAGSWCTGYPEICPSPTCTQPLNVANNKTFDVITEILNECTGGVVNKPGNPSPGLFKSNMIHLGGDEVSSSFLHTRRPTRPSTKLYIHAVQLPRPWYHIATTAAAAPVRCQLFRREGL